MVPSKVRLVFAATVATVVIGCGDPEVTYTPPLGKVDAEALEDGVTVTLTDDLGTLTVPFTVAVDYQDEDAFREALSNAVDLLVTSEQTGTSADLSSGVLIDGTPDDAGEWTFAFNDDGTEAELTFFNNTPGGLTLKVGASYEAALTIAENDYIEALPATTVSITVVDE